MGYEHIRSNIQELTGQTVLKEPLVFFEAVQSYSDLIAEEEREAVSAPNRKARELDNEINLAGAGGSLSGIQRLQQWNQYNNQIRKRNGSKADTTASDLAILQGQLTTLDIEIAQIKSRMEELKTEIAANEDRIEDLEERITGVQGAIDDFHEAQRFELNADGSLANEQAEAALRAYEKRMGLEPGSIDRSDPAAVLDALEEQKEHDEREVARLERENQAKQGEYDQKERELEDKEREREVVQAEVDAENAEAQVARTQRQAVEGVTDAQYDTDINAFATALGSGSNNFSNAPVVKAAFSTEASGEAVKVADDQDRETEIVPKGDTIQPI
ncbi:MAG: hypothetical protein AAF221_07915 [Pseudomonadota bacterium]